jgi:hypothetical protein
LDSLFPALGKVECGSCISAEVDWLRTIPDVLGIVVVKAAVSWFDEEGDIVKEDEFIASHWISYFMLKSKKLNQFF